MRKIMIICVLIIAVSVLAVAQEKEKQEPEEKKSKPTVQEVEAKYSPQIKRLEGIRNIKIATKGEAEFLLLEVDTKERQVLLDNLLSDELEGFKLIFQVIGKESPDEPGHEAKKMQDAPEKETPLCFKCAGPKYKQEKGLCRECGGWSKSTDFKLCDECARKSGVCARCGGKFKQDK